MGFFFTNEVKLNEKNKKSKNKKLERFPEETLIEKGCLACSLDKFEEKLITPKMKPAKIGSTFYILGDFPRALDDQEGKHFKSFLEYIEGKIPNRILKNSVKDYMVKCATPNDRIPAKGEIFCCKGKLISSIEKYKPWAIIGLGSFVLNNLLGAGGSIADWRGRKIPIKIGNHVCWFFPVYDIDYLLYRQSYNKNGEVFLNEYDKVFIQDFKNVIREYNKKDLDNEVIPLEDPKNYFKNTSYVMGEGRRDLEKVFSMLDYFEIDRKEISVDYETQNLRPYDYSGNKHKSRLLTVSISDGKKSFSFPLDHPLAWKNEKHKEALYKRYKKFLKKSGIKVAHNLNMEGEWSAFYFGYESFRRGDWGDTYALAYILDPRKGMLNLDTLVFSYFGFWLKDLFKLDLENMVEEDLEDVLKYNVLDSKYTILLFKLLNNILDRKGNSKLKDWCYPHHIRTSKSIVKTQLAGICPDIKETDKQAKDLDSKLSKCLKKISKLPETLEFKKLTGNIFNPLSPDHIVYVLGTILKRDEVNVQRKNRKSSTSADESVLKSIPESATLLPKLCLEYRSLNTRRSTFIESIYTFTSTDGFIHPNYNDKFTSTGRLSSDNPNLQNFPYRTHKEIRKVIKSLDGYRMCSGDYGQIEARVIAMASEDENYVKAWWNDFDIHLHWAKIFIKKDEAIIDRAIEEFELKNADDKKIMDSVRFICKNRFVFPNFFGASPRSVAVYMKTDEDLINVLLPEFWDEYSGIKRMQKRMMNQYNEKGYVETLTGRKRYAPIRYTEIINTPIQGTASDIVVDAMNRLTEEGFTVRLNIHDDLAFYFPENNYVDDIEIAAEIMCFPDFDFINVPITVEFTVGSNWAEQKDYEVFKSNEYE